MQQLRIKYEKFEYLLDTDFSTLYSYMVILKTLHCNNISGTTALHENVIKLFLNKKETNGI